MADFEREFQRARTWSASSRTTARTATSSTPPTRSSRNNRKRLGKNLWTASRRGRAAARLRRRVRRRRGALDRRGGEGACARGHARSRRSRCCTAPTRSRACSSMRCSSRACPTASTAGCASSSARRSSMRSPTCAWSRSPDDDNAFLRVVNFPPRGIGARTVEQLQDAAKAAARACSRLRQALPRQGRLLFVALIEDAAQRDAGPAAAEMRRARDRRRAA